MKYIPLTDKDRRTIRNDMKPGMIFGILAFCAGMLASILLALDTREPSYTRLALLLLASVGIGLVVYRTMNRKHIKDLKHGNKKVVVATVQQKVDRSIFGSDRGKGPMPTLTNLVATMEEDGRKEKALYFFVVNGKMSRVPFAVFNATNEGDLIEMHYTEYGNNFLGFHNPK